jgi:hypothetical protein
VKLHEPSSWILRLCIVLPTIAGIGPCRRRHCLRRLLLLRHEFFQLVAPTRSPWRAGSCAQVPCPRWPPEPHRRRRPLRRRLGSSSGFHFPATLALDKWSNGITVSS